MRMPGIEMIDSHPIELSTKINLGFGHHITDEGFEVCKLGTILRRNNQPELVTVIFAPVEKHSTIGFVDIPAIEFARFSFGRDTIALDVAEMSARCPEIAMPKLGNPGLDDDATISAYIETSSCQSSEGTAAPDP
jgi:hypothetical protein